MFNDLKSLGEYLYGGGWQTALAKDLDVNDRTVRRWMDGTHSVPQGVWQEIIELAAARQLQETLPVLENLAKQHGLPEVIDLYVYPDGKVLSPHARTWSYETDLKIKTALSKLLTESGIPAQVVFK